MNLLKILSLLGFPGFYLYLCRRRKADPSPVKVRIFGNIRTLHEIRNIFDNFGKSSQIRDRYIESYLAGRKDPVIIDCGVNVGVTARWWLHLNGNSTVFGVDMIKECHDFTADAVISAGYGAGRYAPVTAALWSEDGKRFTVAGHDPLCGDHSFDWPGSGENARTFVTKRLDTVFGPDVVGHVDLIKIDLEGAGGSALLGGPELLKRTRNVVMEVHNEKEALPAKKALKESGFVLRRTNGRHLWWIRT